MAVLGVVAAASLAYAVVPGLGGGLRKVVWVKTPLIAAVWATATTHHPELGWDGVLWVQRFVFIAGLTLPFDIRDLDVDRHHMETLPQVTSPERVLLVGPTPACRRRAPESGRVGVATRPTWGPPHRCRAVVARLAKRVGRVVDSAQGGPEHLGEFRRMDARAQDGLAARRGACDALRRGPDVVRRALDAGARDVRLNPGVWDLSYIHSQPTSHDFDPTCTVGFFATLVLALNHAQWEYRLVLSSVAQSDDEEKDIWPADLPDGWTDAHSPRRPSPPNPMNQEGWT